MAAPLNKARCWRASLLAGWIVAVGIAPSADAQIAELAFVNGKVFTADAGARCSAPITKSTESHQRA